jgi:glycosyl transferase, family 25
VSSEPFITFQHRRAIDAAALKTKEPALRICTVTNRTARKWTVLATRKVVINLKDRKDRRFDMEAQLHRVGWQAEFFNAVRPETAGDFPSLGARGCFLSHLEVVKQSIGDGRHLIIMEDDLNFSRDFSLRWPKAINELVHRDWSVFYPAHGAVDQVGLSLAPSTLALLCTHFLVLHRDCLVRIRAALDAILARPAGHPFGGPMHTDGAYSTIRAQNPDLNTYTYAPPLGYQRSSRSDIATPRLRDYLPGVGRLRRMKQWVQPLLKE